MQVIKQNIQRPTLFQEFFDKLITYSNEVIEYINTSTINNVTSNYRKTAITLTNIIKNNIKNIIKDKFIQINKFLKNLFQGVMRWKN